MLLHESQKCFNITKRQITSEETWMNVMAAPPELPPGPPPEVPPEELPTKGGRTAYRVLLIVLLASLLLFTLVVVFPLLTTSRNQQLISSFWSGYTVASDLNYPQPNVTGVNGSWTVPTVNVSNRNSFSVAWIGIGGQFDGTLIQVGTEQDSARGHGAYSAWYELLNASAVTISSLSIMPGDRITGSIRLLDLSKSIWSIEIYDVTNEESFQKNVSYPSSMLSAEWIVERPIINTLPTTLADFGQITFTRCTAAISGIVGTVGSFPHIQVLMYSLQNAQLVNVSPLTSNGSSFTVNYLD